MFKSRTPIRSLLGGLLLLAVLMVAGCGLLGGEEDEEDFPEPPQRPDSEVVDRGR